jgi:hypothetical protein
LLANLTHTEPRMKALGILKLEDLHKQQSNMLVYDCLSDFAPKEIGNFFHVKTETNDYTLRTNTQNPQDIVEIKFKTKQGKNSLRAKAPNLWNNLTNEIREQKNRTTFKNQLKNNY